MRSKVIWQKKELNNRLKKHIDEMRETACIKINYKGE